MSRRGRAHGDLLMWLKVGEVGYLEVDFWHSHGDEAHLHDGLVASVEAHQLAHRLASYRGAAEPQVR